MLAVVVWYYNNQTFHERVLPKVTYFKSENYSVLHKRQRKMKNQVISYDVRNNILKKV